TNLTHRHSGTRAKRVDPESGDCGARFSGAQLRTVVRARARPGMTGLKPQHRLGDDVALDLVGAAVDRDLAVVEVARRDLRGPVHRLVAAGVAVLVVGSCE